MLKKIRSISIISVFMIFQLIFLPVAWANPGKIADIEEGDTAPFSGVLLTENIATRLYIDSKFSVRECDVRISEKISEKELFCKKGRDLLILKLNIQEEKYEKIISFKNNRVNFLEKNWKPRPWYKSSEFWFSSGIISGILLTVAAGYALRQVSK